MSTKIHAAQWKSTLPLQENGHHLSPFLLALQAAMVIVMFNLAKPNTL